MVWLSIVIGFILGALIWGVPGGLAGAFVGFIVGMALRSRKRNAPAQATSRSSVRPPGQHDANSNVLARLSAIEARLAAIERVAGIEPPAMFASATAPSALMEATIAAMPPSAEVAAPVPDPAVAFSTDDAAIAPELARSADGTLTMGIPERAIAAGAPIASVTRTPAMSNRLWAWFTGGNTLTRIGVLILFFGIAFLLKYFSDLVTIPIEVKLLGVALVGVALTVLGMRLARTRPGYGLSLQGAGAGILYLTVFAAFRFYDVLPAVPAFALLFAVAALTVWLAHRADSQALAALAIAGGFLAPFLVATSAGEPARLFGYFAVLNAAIFALAWFRAWRGLNVLGFVFTFALGIFWGDRYYRPEHFATVEPFLVVFFLFYVTIAVLYAKRGALEARAPVDALLVFGVPLVGFALQAALVNDTRYGVAWSAVAIAALYGALAVALYRRPEPGLSLLGRAFGVLSIIFATIAIPFAADPRWTSAWWALESAGVYWIGCRQRQMLPRVFALLLQLGATMAFIAGGVEHGELLFLNATFLGTTLIALAALATAFVADRHRDVVTGRERALVGPLVLWGVAWWYGGGALELSRALPSDVEANAILAYATGSVAAALLLRRWLRWSRLAWFGIPLLPLMAVVALADWDRIHTSLFEYGWIVWPLAWVVHWRVLRAGDALRADEVESGKTTQRTLTFLHFAHAASAIAVVGWVAWEASEWVGRVFPPATVWVACAAAWPAIAYLALIVRVANSGRWPFADYADAYAKRAGTAIAAMLAVWFVIVNVISPGGAAPLPYAPIVNPLDVTLIAALAVLFAWVRATADVAERTLYAWFGVALFMLLNAMVFRSVHQWLGVSWRLGSLLSSKPLQAALTLTWTATALPLMLLATRRAIRPLWMVGAGLLAIVVVKLFVVDLSALSGLPRVVAFIGVGVLLLIIGYLAPLPPAAPAKSPSAAR